MNIFSKFHIILKVKSIPRTTQEVVSMRMFSCNYQLYSEIAAKPAEMRKLLERTVTQEISIPMQFHIKLEIEKVQSSNSI